MVQVNWIRANSVRTEQFRTRRAAKRAIKRSEARIIRMGERIYFPSNDKVYDVYLEAGERGVNGSPV